MTERIPWPGATGTLERVVEALRAGRVLAVPTESGYEGAVFGLHEAAAGRLTAMMEGGTPLAVALKSAEEAVDWLPRIRGVGPRLMRAFWPGPLVIVARVGMDCGLVHRLPSVVREPMTRGGIALRHVDRDDIHSILRSVDGPILMGRLPGAPTSPEAAGKIDGIDLVLDAGLSPLFVPPSVVEVESREMRVAFEGAIPRGDLEEAGRRRILFACTGNTCRSPLAEALCRRLLADTLNCAPEELGQRGFEVGSCGLAAIEGQEASPESVAIAEARGGDLRQHRSRGLTLELLAQADHLFTMTGQHRGMLVNLNLPVGPAIQTLSPFADDVPDPIGGPRELYEACADQIVRDLQLRLPEILE